MLSIIRTIYTAHVYTYELTEAPVSGTLPSYTFSENWPKEVGDVLELNSAGEPIKAKDAFKASSSQMEGSFLVTIADASATITNVQTGKLNIVKQWAEEVEYDGAQNPLDALPQRLGRKLDGFGRRGALQLVL